MRPLRLEVEGFTSFRERTAVSFEDTDLFVLTGATGAGKSSLIDAMVFALYGSVPRYDDRRLVAPVISQGREQARVRLEFEARGRRYTAVRVVRRTHSDGASTREARLEEVREGGDPRVLASTADELGELVRSEVIGLDLDHFTKCVVLPQGEFATFMRARPGEREKLLVQLLGLGLYGELRKRANQLANEHAGKAQALAERLEAPELAMATPEAVREAEARVAVLQGVQEEIRAAIPRLEELAHGARDAAAARNSAERSIGLLREVRQPEGVEEIAGEIAAAERALEGAQEAMEGADRALVAARKAREQLPEASALERIQQDRGSLASHEEELVRITAEFKEARRELARAERAVEEAAAARAQAAGELEELPKPVELEAVREWRGRLAEMEGEIAAGRREAQSAEALAEAAKHDAERAQEALAEATQALDALRVRHSAADLARQLREGEECPVCLQSVEAVPEIELPAELDGAEEARRRAEAEVNRAREELKKADAAQMRTVAGVDQQERSAEEFSGRLEGAPTLEEVDVLKGRIEAVRARVEDADAEGKRADQLHRERELERGSVQTLFDERTKSVASLRESLEGAAAPEVVAGQLIAIEDAAEELRRAGKAADDARAALGEAQRRQDALRERGRGAWSDFRVRRDTVAELGPPGSEGDDLAGSWASLCSWAEQTQVEQGARRDEAEEEGRRVAAEGLRVRSGLVERCLAEGLEVQAGDDPGTICAAALGAAGREAAHLRKRAAERERAERSLRQASDDAAVARELGGHLSATGFGRWMQNRVLEWLVAGATQRLRELSSGQYSLDLSPRNDFLVIDHRNADEPRSAKTLSGGETFLASLALALSLAEQVAGLAAQGSARLDALFLDEGFGALDPDTLEVVAASIEQLGTERMVGLVTHVAELAGRIPVQYRVKKVGNSSSVERMET